MKLTRRDALFTLGGATLSGAAAPEPVYYLTAREQARMVRQKKISARELLEVHLKRIEAVNPRVNAIVTLVADKAREAAAAADEAQARGKVLGVLHGLPIAHKDLVNTKGIRTTYGSPLTRDFVPTADALIITRMRAAGAITIGKTNTPEFGAGSQTFNTVFGATLNPYDVTKTCGGSSGGAAVALATGMIPLADGSDMGGSLRNPAAYSNIVGFRPSIGRVVMDGGAFLWQTLSTAGPMARNVEDLALLLSVQAGPDPLVPNSLPEPGATFRRPLARSFKGVRIAWFQDLNGEPFDPRVTAVVNAQRKAFEAMGAIVEVAEPDFSGADFAFKTLRAWNSAATHAERVAKYRGQYKDTLLAEIEAGLKLTAGDVAKAEMLHGQVWLRFQQFLSKYEYFVLPTTQLPPFDVKTPYPTEVAGRKMTSYIDWMKSCWYISTTGNPAISVPAGFTPEGLPVGLQIVGRHQADLSVLELAYAYEQATKVGMRRPQL
jgi:amidase